MRIILPILLLLLYSISNLLAQDITENDLFTSPLKIPFHFSGGFGELRPNHFHSGLDFRTQGRTGLPVYAAKDGYISRIGVSPTGYGNALYMNHPDGTTTLYGHLEKFIQKIEEYVRDKQYERETFQINLTLSSGVFRFKKGDIIAWSGNSGSSGGPHLHFEIRNTESERAYNPIFYNLGIKDKSAPKIKAVYAYPLSPRSNVGLDRTKKRFEVMPVSGGWRLKNNLPMELFGEIGFGIQADDDFDGTGLKCGIYSATLKCDGKEVFGFKMDNISFDDMRYANSQADYEEYVNLHRWVQRLYKQPGNHLDIYDTDDKNGILNLSDGKGHEIEIIVSDAFKNKTSLKFRTISKTSQLPPKNQLYSKQFLIDQTNTFENDIIRIELAKDALYDNLNFVWKSNPKPTGCYSELHQVHSKFVPLHKPYLLEIKCEDLPDNLKDKALIVSIDQKTGQKSSIGGEYSSGWVSAKTYQFGYYAIAVDNTPPVITSLSIKDKKTLTNQSRIQFKIADNLSGIGSYRGEIDGKWILFEYDTKSKTITYHFDKDRMVFGKSHLLRLVVADNKGNSSEFKAIIYR